jgi:hypothetical protein
MVDANSLLRALLGVLPPHILANALPGNIIPQSSTAALPPPDLTERDPSQELISQPLAPQPDSTQQSTAMLSEDLSKKGGNKRKKLSPPPPSPQTPAEEPVWKRIRKPTDKASELMAEKGSRRNASRGNASRGNASRGNASRGNVSRRNASRGNASRRNGK